ncbi:hypothetical protein HERIO_1126 [Hepatospora eriocheir]|uniref:Uncharacterized protein n=1 Tax=Hepatospora eriocheir TaxID=1081669 RepID=A0A1X0QB73_9MICR|nr:hypothetical protein HERIO_1126 [Hepatospora eriocheir]
MYVFLNILNVCASYTLIFYTNNLQSFDFNFSEKSNLKPSLGKYAKNFAEETGLYNSDSSDFNFGLNINSDSGSNSDSNSFFSNSDSNIISRQFNRFRKSHVRPSSSVDFNQPRKKKSSHSSKIHNHKLNNDRKHRHSQHYLVD